MSLEPHLTKPIGLDHDDANALFSHIFGIGKAEGSPVAFRLKYLQKIGFALEQRSGRGRRTVHALPAVLKLAFALALIDLEVPAGRAAATVDANWAAISAVLDGAWSMVRAAGRPDGPAQTVFGFTARGLATDEGPLSMALTSGADLTAALMAADPRSAPRLIMNPVWLVIKVVDGLKVANRYRDDEIGAAFDALAAGLKK
ncbi:hypothetical protein EQZ23_06865 [Sphingomonas sp. UV9]|uniref:hypothetical protein n=1 Tax=Sphingomonas sp. UV9 TaxID=1851410 RepID=UPI000FFC2456|nr:hypothetical protein [Sphingomonas sp. UV9]RXD04857.1 hypothetical protein EQZ23_06865 [Sphingomonas sp. UV9]